MPKLVHVVTVPVSLSFLTGQAVFMRSHGFDTLVVSSPGSQLDHFAKCENVKAKGVAMTRSVSPVRDLAAVFRLARLFRSTRPDIVHAHTPKAGLLAMVAASIARTPCRFFHIHGHPHSTSRGLSRAMLRLSTRLSCRAATHVLSVSQSALRVAIDEGFCGIAKAAIIGSGSSNGVDARNRFEPRGCGPFRDDRSAGTFVIAFAGRLVRDKGICELHEAWQGIRTRHPNARLLIAGETEERDPVPETVLTSLRADDRVRIMGWTDDMPGFYRSIDVLALPSYREGLPTVVLEAAAMEVPTVAARSVGCVDAVIDGVTGTLVDVGDARGLAAAIERYIADPELRAEHGRAARDRVLRDFRPEDVWRATLQQYELALNEARRRRGVAGRAVKRLFDICLSAIALTLLTPLLLLIAALVKLTTGRPVLFRQARPGRDECSFRIIKFRTMRDAFDRNGRPLPDGERLTRVGRFLRATSLDELPELWNVLRGEMSLVGPRPLLPEYLSRYNAFQRRRHEVRPGVTGWAQIHGRNGLSWSEKFEHDVWYVDNRSMLLDLKILARTLVTVLHREGIASDGHATMPEFTGAGN